MKRKLGQKLVLSRETVRELTDSQLEWVAGGNHTLPHLCIKSHQPGCTAGQSRNTPSVTGYSCICPTCGTSCAAGANCCP